MRKNIKPAGPATLACTLVLFCAASTHAQEEQGSAERGRAGVELAAVESRPTRLEPAGKPEQAALVKGVGGPRHEKLGAAVFRLTGLKLFADALRSESEKTSPGARPSELDGGVQSPRRAQTQSENFIIPHPNERRSNSEPYRPHN